MLHLISKKKGKMQPTRTKTFLENTTAQKQKGKKQGIKWKRHQKQNANPRGGVTRPPSQFESYSLSASSKSYSGRSYSAPKPD